MTSQTPSTVIKKYANRRLYHTGTSAYVTLEDLAEMVRQDEAFVVLDAKSGEDITRGVLAQIIFDAESKGAGLLPIAFLRQLITFYGGGMQALVPTYLEHALASFAREQERLRKDWNAAVGATTFSAVEDQVRRNMDMFQRSVRLFMPFAGDPTPGTGTKTAAADDVATLRGELASIHARIDALAASQQSAPRHNGPDEDERHPIPVAEPTIAKPD